MSAQRYRPCYTSWSDDWATPRHVFEEMDREFAFTLDACPLGGERQVLGLLQSWAGQRVYCNPPYAAREVRRWLEKAAEADLVVYLLPARTDTGWWHDFAMRAAEIRFIRGRLKYVNPEKGVGSAPFPSVVLVYRQPQGAGGLG